MAKPFNTTPIGLDEALLNPGGDELDTHLENESNIIHTYAQIKFSPIEISVTTKLVNLIRGHYQSPVGEYPITEFYYQITDEEIRIYDRKGSYLLSAGVGSFTIDEVNWILDNLPIYNTGEENQDISQIHIDFREMRNEGWMVFRRSGNYNQLIGWIRKNLAHVYQEPFEEGVTPLYNSNPVNMAEYYFDERIDRTEVSKYELDIINKFIENTIPTIDVTDIAIDITTVQLLIGETQPVTITIYPLQATNQNLNIQIDNNIATFENNIIEGIDEGFTDLVISSQSNPEVSQQISIEVLEARNIISTRYDIIDDNELYDYEGRYIINIEPGLTIAGLLDTLKNRSSNITVKDIYDQEYIPEVFSDTIVSTGMRLILNVHGVQYDEVRLIIRGDLNSDGYVNEWDKQMIRDYVNGYIPLEGESFIAADVNNDGVVDLDDLNIIDRYFKGEIDSLNKF